MKYEVDQDINQKTKKEKEIQAVCGTLCRSLYGKTKRDTRQRFYTCRVVPVLLYGSEACAVMSMDERLHSLALPHGACLFVWEPFGWECPMQMKKVATV